MLQPSEEKLHRLDARFSSHLATLHSQLELLVRVKPFKYGQKPKDLPSSVVYLFSEDEKPLYIGRTRKFGQRLGNHCRPGSAANQSSFAYKIACRAIGFEPERYGAGNSAVRHVKEHPGLAEAFAEAKQKLRSMEIRYVSEPNDLRQALLEIYCSVALDTPFNSWKTS